MIGLGERGFRILDIVRMGDTHEISATSDDANPYHGDVDVTLGYSSLAKISSIVNRITPEKIKTLFVRAGLEMLPDMIGPVGLHVEADGFQTTIMAMSLAINKSDLTQEFVDDYVKQSGYTRFAFYQIIDNQIQFDSITEFYNGATGEDIEMTEEQIAEFRTKSNSIKLRCYFG